MPSRTQESSTRRRPRILVAGQVPPPICGQNLSIARMLRLIPKSGEFEVDHWKFHFTPDWGAMRAAGPGKILELFRVWWRLLKLRNEGPIDAILYPVGGPHLAPLCRDIALLPLARMLSPKVILHFRAAGLARSLPDFPAPVSRMVTWLYRKCGYALSLSEYGRVDPEAAGVEHVSVIPNALEDHFNPEWQTESKANDPVVFFNAGLLCHDKGTPALVKAFAEIHRKNPNTRLRLAGQLMPDLQPEEDFRAHLRELGIADAVELCGVLRGDDFHRAYAEADVFVFSSVAPVESFGNVLAEALMWKLPIVATDWRANSEVVGEGFGGELAEIGDDTEGLAKGLTEAMARLLARQTEWKEMGERNRERYLSTYEIDPHEERLLEYFRSIT